MERAEKIKFVQDVQGAYKAGLISKEEATAKLGQFASEHARNNEAKLPGNFTIGELRNETAKMQASGSMQVGLPSGINAEAAKKIQGYGGGGSGTPITSHPFMPSLAQTPAVHPSSTMGRPPPGIFESNVGQGTEPVPEYRIPTPMMQSGQGQRMPVPGPRQQSEIPAAMVSGTSRPQMSVPGPGQQQDLPRGLLQQGMDGLRGMGRSLGAGAKSLFDDPSRMAMLQGGLSMMDPNSYYDKQGFGSVFTGMNRGLGAAQAGHKGVLDRRALVQKTAADQAAAANSARGGKSTYKTITENTENGGTRKVNYRIDGQGNKTPESYSDVLTIVSGVNKDGKLAVQQWNNTTKTATDIVVKKTDFTPDQIMGAVNILQSLDKWAEVLDANPMSASELTGKGLSVMNWLSESFNQGTPFEGRAEIETMINQLKPMLTPEILKDSRISEAEWKIAKAALGMGKWSTGMDKKRAIPALKKIIRIRSGLPLDGEITASGGAKTATGYTPGSQVKNF